MDSLLDDLRSRYSAPTAVAEAPGNAEGSASFLDRVRRRVEIKTAGDAFSTDALGGDRGVAEYALEAAPLGIGATKQGLELKALYDAAQAFEGDRATTEQMDLLETYVDAQAAPQTFGHKAAKVASDSLQALPGFVTGSGVVTAAGKRLGRKAAFAKIKGAVDKLATKGLAGRAAAGFVRTAAVGVGATAANEALAVPAQAAGGSSPVEVGAVRKHLAQALGVGNDEAGEVWVSINGEAASVASHLPAAFFEQSIEAGSEAAGAAFAAPLTRQGAAVSIVGQLFERAVGKVGAQRARNLLRLGGVDSLTSEIGEEAYGAIVQDTLAAVSGGKLADGGNTEGLFQPENFAAMVVGIGAFTTATSVGAGALGAAGVGSPDAPELTPYAQALLQQIQNPAASPSGEPGAESAVPSGEVTPGAQPAAGPSTSTEGSESVEAGADGPSGSVSSVDPSTVGYLAPEQVEADIDRYREVTGDPGLVAASPLEGEAGETFQALGQLAEQYGATLVPVQGSEGQALPIAGLSRTPGQILVDPNNYDPVGVFWHELAHNLNRELPAEFSSLAADLQRLDPEGFAVAQGEASGSSEAELSEEAVARRVEALGGYLSALASPGGEAFIQRALAVEADRGILRRIVDALKSALAKITGGKAQTRAGKLEAISEELGQDFDGTDAQLAKRVLGALQEGAGVALDRATGLRRQAEAAARDEVKAQAEQEAVAQREVEEARKREQAKKDRAEDQAEVNAQSAAIRAQNEVDRQKRADERARREYEAGPQPVEDQGGRRVLDDLAALGGIDLRQHLKDGKLSPEAQDLWQRFQSKEAGERTHRWLKGPGSKAQPGVDLETAGKLLAEEGWAPADGLDRIERDQLFDLIDTEVAGGRNVHPEDVLDDDGPAGGGYSDWIQTDDRFARAPREESAAFKRWFGDSKVVDADGKPLVVYHGAPDMRGIWEEGFRRSPSRGDAWFATDSTAVAESYADDSRAWDYQRAEHGLVPLFLSIQNPMEVNARGQHWRETERFVEEARAAGHDGLVIRNSVDFYNQSARERRTSTVFVFFKPTQAKSAAEGPIVSRVTGDPIPGTGPNAGTFDPGDPNLRHAKPKPKPKARKTPAPKAFAFAQVRDLGEEGSFADLKPEAFQAALAEGKSVGEVLYGSLDQARRVWQDKALPMRRFEEQIKREGGLVRSSAYSLASNVEGMKAYRHQELERDYLTEIEKALKGSELSAADAVAALDDLAVARYHHERKRLIRGKKDAAQARVDRILGERKLADDVLAARMEGFTQRGADLREERSSPLFEGRTEQDINRELDALKYERRRARDTHNKEQKARTKALEAARRDVDKFPGEGAWAPDSTAITGITDAEAEQIIRKADDSVQAAHQILVQMNNWTRDLMVEHGHVTRAWANWMKLNQPNYVPLRDVEADTDFHFQSRIGGFNTPGPEFEPAFGRNTRAANSLFFSAVQAQDAITRTSNGEVGRAFLQMLEDNPDLREWKEVDAPPNGEGFKPEPDDTTFEVKRDGESIWIAVQDERLVGVLKGMQAEPLGKFLSFSGTVTRFIAQMSTSRNPAFTLPNILRDGLQAAIAVGERSDVKVADIVTGWKSAAVGMWRQIHGEPAVTQMDTYAVEFAEDGGLTGHSMQQDYEALGHAMVKRIARGRIGTAIGPGGFVWQAMDNFNSMTENATRVAVYAAMRKNGTPRQEAASYARDLTVNFARKGEMGTTLNALFMFANVGIQGSHRVIQTMRSPKVRSRLAGVVLTSIMLDVMNRAMAGDDEDGRNAYDAIPRHVRERNLILMVPGGRDAWVKIPLPYGFNLFSVIGQSIGAMGSGARGSGEVAGDLVSAAMGSFNPVGSDPTVSALQFVAPTILDPAVQIAENQNWFGAPIAPGGGSYDKRPDSQRYNRSVSGIARGITDALNRWTGGDETAGGWADISPETLEHWYEFATGGAGKFVERVGKTGWSLATEGSAPINDFPIVRRFLGVVDDRRSKSYYYDNREAVQTAARRVRAHEREGRRTRARELRREFGWLIKLEDGLKGVERQRKRLVERKLGAADDQVERLEKQEVKLMQRWNRQYTKAAKAWGGK